MAYVNFIPKIQWLKNTADGTSAVSSDTITGVADTTSIQAGMFIRGTGIPDGTTVLSTTASTIVMSAQATAAGTNTFNLGFEIEFELPPAKDPFNQGVNWKGKVTVSKNGAIQRLTDYLEESYKVDFSHIPEALKNSVENFVINHMILGRQFSYFTDKQEDTSELIVEASQRFTKFEPKIITRKGAGKSFLYKFKLEFRRLF